ncbi:hypothetical protein DFP73DRAFT_522223 [Morchella snyderi]|nr:hypothetical protein DFP73DRAFT_522223 [Morchella snyderi]
MSRTGIFTAAPPEKAWWELEMTPGVVSGIIAACILIIQYTLPLFIGVVLAGVIENASTANTWTVINTMLHSSRLHTVNFSDSVSTWAVARPVLLLYYLGIFTLGLTALSGVLTPMGIHDTIAGRNAHGVSFHEALDGSSFGYGTVGHAQYALTRACGVNLKCPGQENITSEVEEVAESAAPSAGETGRNLGGRGGYRQISTSDMSVSDGSESYSSSSMVYGVSSSGGGGAGRNRYSPRLARRSTGKKQTYRVGSAVPQPLDALFRETSPYGENVASVFDIQYRNYISLPEKYKLPSGKNYTIGQFRFLDSVVASQDDSQGYSQEYSQDGTEEYDQEYSQDHRLINGLIVDTANGGVGFRNHMKPGGEWSAASWEEVLLWMEPETVCVANNVSLEVTTDNIGSLEAKLLDAGGFGGLAGLEEATQVVADKEGVPDLAERARRGAYHFNKDVGTALSGWKVAEVGGKFNITGKGVNITSNGMWVEKLQGVVESLKDGRFVVQRMPLGAKFVNGVQNSTGIDTHCAGFVSTTASGAPLVTCGLIIGAPENTDPGSTSLESIDVYPLYTCATAVRASLRRVNFSYNQTTASLYRSMDRLDFLKVGKPRIISPPPTWGIEMRPDFNASGISLLWGALGPKTGNAPNLTVRKADYLYLPAGEGSDGITDSLAGTGAYQYAAGLIYESHPMMPDYSGKTSYNMYREWEWLTGNVTLVGQLPNLLWTDLISNMVTTVSAGGKGVKDVHVFERRLGYHLLYAVPVMVLVLLWVAAWGVSLAFWLGDRVRVKEVRQLLNQVSTGRAVVNALEESKEGGLPTKTWAKGKGETVVGLKCEGTGGTVGEMMVRFTKEPAEGRVLELLKGR